MWRDINANPSKQTARTKAIPQHNKVSFKMCNELFNGLLAVSVRG